MKVIVFDCYTMTPYVYYAVDDSAYGFILKKEQFDKQKLKGDEKFASDVLAVVGSLQVEHQLECSVIRNQEKLKSLHQILDQLKIHTYLMPFEASSCKFLFYPNRKKNWLPCLKEQFESLKKELKDSLNNHFGDEIAWMPDLQQLLQQRTEIIDSLTESRLHSKVEVQNLYNRLDQFNKGVTTIFSVKVSQLEKAIEAHLPMLKDIQAFINSYTFDSELFYRELISKYDSKIESINFQLFSITIFSFEYFTIRKQGCSISILVRDREFVNANPSSWLNLQLLASSCKKRKEVYTKSKLIDYKCFYDKIVENQSLLEILKLPQNMVAWHSRFCRDGVALTELVDLDFSSDSLKFANHLKTLKQDLIHKSLLDQIAIRKHLRLGKVIARHKQIIGFHNNLLKIEKIVRADLHKEFEKEFEALHFDAQRLQQALKNVESRRSLWAELYEHLEVFELYSAKENFLKVEYR